MRASTTPGGDYAVKRLEAALRSLDDKTRLYQVLFKHNCPEIASAEYDNPLVRAAVEQRTVFLQASSDRYRRYNVPAVCDYEAMKKSVRTCLACGATDVATGRLGFAGPVCAKCLPGRSALWSVRAGTHNEEKEQRREHDD